jgi:hypothetical protein
MQESPTGAPQFVPVYDQLLACSCSTAVVAVVLPCISLHLRCRNRWSTDPSVKTFVCELQIHHQVSDAARRDLCVRFSVTCPPKEMLPSKVLDFWLKSPPEGQNEAALKNDETLAEEFHKRYVEKRDKLAS